jgi:hypothetical protein
MHRMLPSYFTLIILDSKKAYRNLIAISTKFFVPTAETLLNVPKQPKSSVASGSKIEMEETNANLYWLLEFEKSTPNRLQMV